VADLEPLHIQVHIIWHPCTYDAYAGNDEKAMLGKGIRDSVYQTTSRRCCPEGVCGKFGILLRSDPDNYLSKLMSQIITHILFRCAITSTRFQHCKSIVESARRPYKNWQCGSRPKVRRKAARPHSINLHKSQDTYIYIYICTQRGGSIRQRSGNSGSGSYGHICVFSLPI
jgi:hypothetical protein